MISVLSWVVAIPLSIALLVFSLETLTGIYKNKRQSFDIGNPDTVILIPAHNEELNISKNLAALMAFLPDGVRLLVVADNCNDGTASHARDLGIEVIERLEPERRGKGFALAFGRDHLVLNPPECVIVLDADCESDAQSISDLAKLSLQSRLPVQAQNLMYSEGPERPMVQISNFAFWIKNAVRQRGVSRMGGAALLGGTGMAFPWSLFEKLPLATSSIVEDLGLGIYLTKEGFPPSYLDQAVVLSKSADENETIRQRSRWEIGFLTMAREYGLKSLWLGLLRMDRKLFQLGLHLIVPPIALLFAVTVLTLVVISSLSVITSDALPSLFLLGSLISAIGSIVTAWAFSGHQFLSAATLIRLPLYLTWKIPIYLKLAKGDVPEWKRTERRNDERS